MPAYVIGIDGGGSKTEAVVLDQEGTVRGRVRGPASNPYQVGWRTAMERVASVMKRALEAAEIELRDVAAATWALAGVDRPADRAQWHTWARQQWPGLPVRIENDALAALVGGIGQAYGIVLIAGTGMIAYGVDAQGHRARAGGWGYRLDRGSGYGLGAAAVRAVLAAHDGMDLSTRLSATLLELLRLDTPEALLSWFYHPDTTPDAVAALAPHVIHAAEKGDPVAASIVGEAADALAQAVHAVAAQLNFTTEAFPLVLAGGLLRHSPFYRDLVLQAIRARLPRARPALPQADAAVGAAQLAWEYVGHSPSTSQQSQSAPTSLPSTWSTEEINVLTRGLDLKTPFEIVGLMHVEDQRAVRAVRRELPQIARVVEQIAVRLEEGGRLIYVGAGTSGRLGVLDAAECPPTFNTPPQMVVGVLAGGLSAIADAAETAEDDEKAGYKDLQRLNLQPTDVVVGISASGRTPYVIGALQAAREQGALTVALVCNVETPMSRMAEYTIAPLVGPEVIAGSTRLKAGTAQKLVLNMLSTASMVLLGKVYDNLMVDVRPENHKLQQRARRILMRVCGVDENTAATVLENSGGNVKVALVSLLTGCPPSEARQRLDQAKGKVRDAVHAM